MRRARKGILSPSKSGRQRQAAPIRDENINVNEEEKKNLQLKYYGKIIEEDEKVSDKNLAEENTEPAVNEEESIKETNAEETQIEEPVDAEVQAPEQEEYDDVKIFNKADFDEGRAEKPAPTAEEDAVTELEDTVAEVVETKKKKKKFNKKRAVIFSVSLIVIIFASVLAVCMSGFFNSSDMFDENADNYTEPVDEVTGKVNVLLLGVDNEGLRTDTMIIASFDTDDEKVEILSIPRDTRMYIGSRYQKINAAHAISQKNGKIAGPQGSIEAVTRLTGIPINYYVEFSFDAFRDTIDALGGVYYNVPQNMNYKDPTQNLNIHLTQGYQLLDGDKAEQLVRFRSYPEGDIKRVRVQQDFIKAVIEQKLNAGIITKLPDLYKSLTSNVKTSFKLSDMTKYTQSLMNLKSENIRMHELPGSYSGSEYAASYWLPDMNAIKLLVETEFEYDTAYVTNGKAIEGAVYGKISTMDPLSLPTETPETEDVAASTPTPSATATQNTVKTEKPEKTQKATKTATPTPKASAKADKTEEPKATQTPEPATPAPTQSTQTTHEPVYGSSSSNGIINGSEGNTISGVHTPVPTAPVSTPSPVQTPQATQNSGSSGGFVRLGAN